MTVILLGKDHRSRHATAVGTFAATTVMLRNLVRAHAGTRERRNRPARLFAFDSEVAMLHDPLMGKVSKTRDPIERFAVEVILKAGHPP